ncbi:hypothetical protein [Deinococcus phoenicis]|uniref:hypothetical protein n=1 Tax=Deinococcus phoenicis TaxID=1476583 RepID=UPI00126814E4|nr:hypothetical protein [Deinococcus phoenicis]
MRRLLPLLLLAPLASCNQTKPQVQIVSVTVSADVLEACGEVKWNEAAIGWVSGNTEQVLRYLPADGSAASFVPVDLQGRAALLRQAGRYELLNTTRVNLGGLDSTFTCMKNGQTARASVKLASIGTSALTVLNIGGRQLGAEWHVSLPPA